MGWDLLKGLAACGPEGPALRARRARSGREGPARRPQGPARASVARLLYLKLLTRHTINPGTRQTKIQRLDRQNTATRHTKIPHIRQIKNHTYHSITCTEKSPVQDVTPPQCKYKGMG